MAQSIHTTPVDEKGGIGVVSNTSTRLDRCAVCRSETREDHTDLTYDYGTFKIVVTDVPVTTCAECDERYVDGPLGVVIGDIVAEIAEEYGPLVERLAALRGGQVRTSYNESRFHSTGSNQPIFT